VQRTARKNNPVSCSVHTRSVRFGSCGAATRNAPTALIINEGARAVMRSSCPSFGCAGCVPPFRRGRATQANALYRTATRPATHNAPRCDSLAKGHHRSPAARQKRCGAGERTAGGTANKQNSTAAVAAEQLRDAAAWRGARDPAQPRCERAGQRRARLGGPCDVTTTRKTACSRIWPRPRRAAPHWRPRLRGRVHDAQSRDVASRARVREQRAARSQG
jgi:hypothetical protein